MITRILTAAAVCLASSSLLPVAPAEAVTPVVVVDDHAFTPDTVKIRIGQKVEWSFQDSVPHTTTSDQDFWDSGARSAGVYSRRFGSAGSYAYHCELHTEMRGKVLVRMTRDGSPSEGWTLTWSTSTAPGGRNFDVQFKRKGTSAWKTLAKNTTAADGRFDPATDGTYLLRARTGNTDNGTHSGWSPLTSLAIS